MYIRTLWDYIGNMGICYIGIMQTWVTEPGKAAGYFLKGLHLGGLCACLFRRDLQ